MKGDDYNREHLPAHCSKCAVRAAVLWSAADSEFGAGATATP